MRIGGLFEGYGGLTEGVRSVLGGDLAWYSEIDPAASRVLAHHHPGVSNLGDITRVGLPYSDDEWAAMARRAEAEADYALPPSDWSTAEPVDVLTGGFPCQDVSAAGKRAGMAPGTRSGLWTHMAYAISQLRPRLVVVENVRGLLSAEAHCDVERCTWCLGDERDVVLRALGAVLGDLAELGYDAVWCGLRASDVGAPHQRFRVFVVAADTEHGGRHGRSLDSIGGAVGRTSAAGRGEGTVGGEPPADSDSIGSVRGGGSRRRWPGSPNHDRATADAAGNGRHEGWSEPTGIVGGSDAALSGAPAADTAGERHDEAQRATARDAQGGRSHSSARGCSDASTADTDRGRLPRNQELHRRTEVLEETQHGLDPVGHLLEWGDFEPAIRRWERIIGRRAAAPTVVGARGGRVLNPAFVEWLMGLPAGHVTAVEGLSRNDMLKILGNGVVPQQAAAAVRYLLPLLLSRTPSLEDAA